MASKKIHFLLDTYAETRYHRGMAYTNDTGYPSVTQVLRPWIDTQWFTIEARDRGSAVHAALAQYLAGRPAFLCTLPAECRGYFDSGRRWIDEYVADVLLVEERLVSSQWRYCGQPDLIFRGRDGVTILADWKTGGKARWHRLQIAGYRNLARPRITTARGMTVRLHADGSMPSIDEHHAGYEQDLSRLLCAVNLWWFFNDGKNDGKKGGKR